MADCGNLGEAVYAESTGMVDILSTTLAGLYKTLEKPDTQLVRDIKKHCKLPVNAEGSVWELADLREVIEAGSDMVCIGSAITRPHLITERFINFNNKMRNGG